MKDKVKYLCILKSLICSFNFLHILNEHSSWEAALAKSKAFISFSISISIALSYFFLYEKWEIILLHMTAFAASIRNTGQDVRLVIISKHIVKSLLKNSIKSA